MQLVSYLRKNTGLQCGVGGERSTSIQQQQQRSQQQRRQMSQSVCQPSQPPTHPTNQPTNARRPHSLRSSQAFALLFSPAPVLLDEFAALRCTPIRCCTASLHGCAQFLGSLRAHAGSRRTMGNNPQKTPRKPLALGVYLRTRVNALPRTLVKGN